MTNILFPTYAEAIRYAVRSMARRCARENTYPVKVHISSIERFDLIGITQICYQARCVNGKEYYVPGMAVGSDTPLRFVP